MRPPRRPRRHRGIGLPLLALLATTVFLSSSAIGGLTRTNTIPALKASNTSRAATPDTLKPIECAGITLTAKITVSGIYNGASTAELITGSSGIDTINGAGGNDCILGGGGNDALTGGAGTDVCIGGPGVDTFAGNCETQIQ